MLVHLSKLNHQTADSFSIYQFKASNMKKRIIHSITNGRREWFSKRPYDFLVYSPKRLNPLPFPEVILGRERNSVEKLDPNLHCHLPSGLRVYCLDQFYNALAEFRIGFQRRDPYSYLICFLPYLTSSWRGSSRDLDSHRSFFMDIFQRDSNIVLYVCWSWTNLRDLRRLYSNFPFSHNSTWYQQLCEDSFQADATRICLFEHHHQFAAFKNYQNCIFMLSNHLAGRDCIEDRIVSQISSYFIVFYINVGISLESSHYSIYKRSFSRSHQVPYLSQVCRNSFLSSFINSRGISGNSWLIKTSLVVFWPLSWC